MRYLGAHLGGGLNNIKEIALKYDINSIQYMPTAPMRWVTKEVTQEAIAECAAMLVQTPIKKVLLHGIYLINLARGDSQMFHLSKMSLVTYLNFQVALEIELKKLKSDIEILGVCFHVGSVQDLSLEESYKRVEEGLNWILNESKGGKLLLESTAGAGQVMGDTFEELSLIRNFAKNKDRVGYVIDTEHTFASGYDWVNDLEGVVGKLETILGMENISCFHLNDSIPDMGSHKDRHANLGEGKIGVEAIKKLVNNQELKNKPFIMETPNLKDLNGVEIEMSVLRLFIGNLF